MVSKPFNSFVALHWIPSSLLTFFLNGGARTEHSTPGEVQQKQITVAPVPHMTSTLHFWNFLVLFPSSKIFKKQMRFQVDTCQLHQHSRMEFIRVGLENCYGFKATRCSQTISLFLLNQNTYLKSLYLFIPILPSPLYTCSSTRNPPWNKAISPLLNKTHPKIALCLPTYLNAVSSFHLLVNRFLAYEKPRELQSQGSRKKSEIKFPYEGSNLKDWFFLKKILLSSYAPRVVTSF